MSIQRKLANILQSAAMREFLVRAEISFRIVFRAFITPIFVACAVVMMSGVTWYWLELVMPAYGIHNGSYHWLLFTSFGVWLLFNVVWNYFCCMFTPTFHPIASHAPAGQTMFENVKTLCCPNQRSQTASRTHVNSESVSPGGSRSSIFQVESPHRSNNNEIGVTNRGVKSNMSSFPSDHVASSQQSVEDSWAYCRKCAIVTPPRAMHCFLCNRCVLGIDHHCPWLATCIGYHNHSYFFLFLFYVTVGCIYLSTWAFPIFYSCTIKRQWHKWGSINKATDRFALTLLGVLPLTFVIAVGGMMLWHALILACGVTSLEAGHVFSWVKDILRENGIFACCKCQRQVHERSEETSRGRYAMVESSSRRLRHEYDQGGMVENWKEQFGVRGYKFWWFWWCMPISHKRSGNGIDRFVVPIVNTKTGEGVVSRASAYTV